MKILVIAVVACSSLAWANSYSTAFPNTENPISQSGRWINGGTVGLDWTNMQTVPGQAYGTENCAAGPTDDSTAVLTGGWGPNQSISYTVHFRTGSSSNEIEGRLNTTILPHSITGYEIDTSIGYVEIVRWNGALGNFDILANPTGSGPGVHEGDVVTATNVNGLITAKINGTTIQTATDTTFRGGSPGIGAFCRGGGGIDSDLSMTTFSASDGISAYLSNGIIDQSRAIDWTTAGLPATFPDGETTTNPWTPPSGRTQCGSTIAAGASSTTINNALIACTAGHFVLLGSGTFTLASTNINMFAANGGCLSPGNCPAAGLNGGGVTLRGSGPNSTKIVMTGSSVIGFGVSWSAPTCTVSASGLYQYSTSLVVTGCSSPPVAGQMIFLQQCDTGWSGASCSTGSSVDNGAVFICGEDPLCQNPANGLGTHAHQKQTLLVTAVSGSGTLTLTLSTPIYLSNWSTANTPTITWTGEVPGQNAPAIYGLGLEDLTVDETGTNWAGISANYGIMLNNCYACWMKGVRVLGNGAAGGGFNFNNTKNVLVANNDFFNNPFISTDGLTIVSSGNADSLIVNNILQYGDCEEEDSGNQGMVWAFNYCRDANTNGYFTVLFQHTAGNAFTLYEGNQMGMADLDTIHGYGKQLITYFRNYLSGWDPPYNTASGPFVMEWDAGARFNNAVGNIFGSSKITNYSSTSAFVYNIGGGCCADQLAGLSALRWGNCDSATGTCRNQSSEIPSTLNNYSSATLTLSGSGTSWSGTIPSANRPILFGSEVLIDQTTGQSPNTYGYDTAYTGTITGANIVSATVNNTTGAVAVTFSGTPPVTPKLNYIFSNGAPSPFVNSVPANNNLPPSFVLPTTVHPSGGTLLSWWKVVTNWATFPTSSSATQVSPFPAQGPDVTGGPYAIGTGSAYDIPAALAYKYLPIDTGTCGTVPCQQSFTITSSSWSGGTETLTVSSLPASVHHLMGGFQLSGVNAACIPSGINFANPYGNNEVLMTSSSATTVSYALPNPGLSCTGTMLWPDVRQFDERVFQTDTTVISPSANLQGSIKAAGAVVLK